MEQRITLKDYAMRFGQTKTAKDMELKDDHLSHSKYQRFAGCGDEESHRRHQYQLNFITHIRAPEMAPFLLQKSER
ncbi:hypothetical protein FCZ53_25550 [Escherichia coli]|nr:hypothetical protein [Escherichia coli]